MDAPTPELAPELRLKSGPDDISPARGLVYGVAFGMVAWGLVAFIVFA